MLEEEMRVRALEGDSRSKVDNDAVHVLDLRKTYPGPPAKHAGLSLLLSLSLSLSPCLSVWLLLYMPVYAHAYAHAHQFSARVDYRRQTRRVLRNDRSKRCRQDDGNQYAHRVFFIIDKFPVPTASTLLQENFHPYLQTA